MKKKDFLTSVAVLATAMAVDASAALPTSLTAQVMQEKPGVTVTQGTASVPAPFVLESASGAERIRMAEHRSHSSHASHASHRSHYSSR